MKFNQQYEYDTFDDGDMVIFDVGNETSHILNCSAAQIVNIVQNNDGITKEEVFCKYEKYLKENFFDLDYGEVFKDFEDTVEILIAKKILVE